MLLKTVTLHDVYEARSIVGKYLPRTPLIRSPRLSMRLGCDAYVKCENLQPTGAFKVRGGLYLVSKLSEDERKRGIITASTGNHGQSIAYAGSIFGVRSIIGVPEHANPNKVEGIKRFGASIELRGADYDEARKWVEDEAERRGYRYIHSANEPMLIAGVGTLHLEIIEELPDVEAIVVPIGAGSCAAAACIVAKSINPEIEVIGVQAEKAPSVYLSWKNKRLIETESAATFADGLATRVPFQLTLDIINKMIDDIVLVTDGEIKSAILTLLETTHQLAEGAGAASTAAALKIKDRLQGRKVAIILTGGNLTFQSLREIFKDPRTH